MRCVHVPLPVVARLPVSKDLHLEVPHHGVHHFPRRRGEQDGEPQTGIISNLTIVLVTTTKKKWPCSLKVLLFHILLAS